MEVLERLYKKVRENPGNRELKISIVSQLQQVVLESTIRVDTKLISAIDGDEDIDIL